MWVRGYYKAANDRLVISSETFASLAYIIHDHERDRSLCVAKISDCILHRDWLYGATYNTVLALHAAVWRELSG